MLEDFSREELFALVWEQPVRQLAAEIGASDVAIHKRCAQLQVPTPPRGYWSKIRAGKRPPKPVLRAYSELVAERLRKQRRREAHRDGYLRMSPLQLDVFGKALALSSAHDGAGGEIKILQTGAHLIDEELAAELVLILQNHYLSWLQARAGDKPVNPSSVRSIQSLVAKLLQIASAHVLVLSTEGHRYSFHTEGPTIVIRLRPAFRQTIANLHAVVVEHDLNYLAYDLYDLEHSWIVQYLYHYDTFTKARSQLCVSRDHLWVECRVRHGYALEDTEHQVKTAKVPVESVAPVDLLPPKEVELTTCLDVEKLNLSKERLQAFLDADRAYDILGSAIHESDLREPPPDSLVLFEKLCLTPGARGAIARARDVARQIEVDLERLEAIMELEREDFCKEALGITEGCTVLSEIRGAPVRLKAERFYAYVSDEGDICISVAGKRYRKDGSLGKREDIIYLRLKANRRN